MKILLNQPYKISSRKFKQYNKHYGIPADACLILPQKSFGDQLQCEVLWKDSDGDVKNNQGLMFAASNLESVDAVRDYAIHSLWETRNTEQLSQS